MNEVGRAVPPRELCFAGSGIAPDTVVVQFSTLEGGVSDPSPRGSYFTHRDTEVITAFRSQQLWNAFNYEHK